MSQARIIEIHGETAGIIVEAGRGFRFFSASKVFDAIDAHIFPSPRKADLAARELLTRRTCGPAENRR